MAVFILITTPVYGQDEALQQINDIKRQNDVYFWGQFAHPNPDSARVKAIASMLDDINLGRDESQWLTHSDISPYVKYIPIPRETSTRGFAYMKKSDVPGGSYNTELEPAAVPDAFPIEAPAAAQVQKVNRPFVPDLFVQGIMERKSFQSVYQYLRALKADGRVLTFGSLHEVDDYSSLALIIFDRQSEQVITVLSSASQDGSRTNLTTGSRDALTNYPKQMTAVIYYVTK